MFVNIFLCLVCFCYAGLFLGRELEISVVNQIFLPSLDSDLILGLLFIILFSNFVVQLVRKNNAVESTAASLPKAVSRDDGSKSLLYLVSSMQEKGRLLDFVMDDISTYSDEDVGRVARVVHQGVREVFDNTMNIKSIHNGAEGEKISFNDEVDFSTYKLIGTGTKKPPFSGTVAHKGWKAGKISIPNISLTENDPQNMVVQAVEIEVK